jgi:hypothetical protein
MFAMKDWIRQSAARVENTRTCGILSVGLLLWLFIGFINFSIVDLDWLVILKVKA